MFSVRRLDLNSSLRRQIVVQSANSSYFFATLHHNIYEWKTGDLGVQTNSMLAAIFVYSVLCRSKGRVHNLVTPCQPACHIVTSWHPEHWDLWLVQWAFFAFRGLSSKPKWVSAQNESACFVLSAQAKQEASPEHTVPHTAQPWLSPQHDYRSPYALKQ